MLSCVLCPEYVSLAIVSVVDPYCRVAGTLIDWLTVPEVALTVNVKPPVTVWSNTSELVLAVSWLSPANFAVIACVPTLSEDVDKLATPFVGAVGLPIAVAPS